MVVGGRVPGRANPSNNVTTANEIHVPVGRAVKIMLQSNDVIHSLWMPNLHGKKDLMPIYPTTFYFEADKPGAYWGQCAEFCGYQHAKMRIMVTAESPDEFQTWLNAGRQTPPPPKDGTVRSEGRRDLLAKRLHAVSHDQRHQRRRPRRAELDPYREPAHTSRQVHCKTPGKICESWITDPQQIKPGIQMPMNEYSDEDL